MTIRLGNCFRTRVLACVAGALATAALGATAPPADGAAAFERLKVLEGTWHATRPDGRKAVTEFEVTAGGTVLLERYSNPAIPGGGKMVTAYHLDGGDLVLTHYCIARNQPTLRAERYDPSTGEVQFEFVSATNLSSPAAGHMRRANYRIQDRDHFITVWEFFQDGKKTMTETESFTRATPTND